MVALAGLAASWLTAGCSPTAAPAAACVQGLSTACQAAYDPPTFGTLYDKLFVPTCASGRGTCHTGDAAKGGLDFSVADDSYARLVDGGRVIPGDPGCSPLMKRVTSSEPAFHMPPGPTSLSAAEQCAIVKWIAAGAKR